MNDTTPQVQVKNSILDPETLMQLFGSSQGQIAPDASSQMLQDQQSTQNALQQYQQARGRGGVTSLFGPKPQGMSNNQWAGLCEKWAEQMTLGHAGVYGSATSAAQHYAQAGQLNPNINQAPPGALVYFSDPNQPNGHVGIMGQNGTFRSATYNGIQDNDLLAWQKSTGQKPLGFVASK